MTFINVERASHGARSVTALYFLGVFDRLASAAAAAAAAAFITRATVQYTGGAYSSSSSPQKPALRTDPLSPAVHLASTKIISALFYPGQQPQPQPQWQKGNWIGSGSSGQVYLGFHSVTGQRCAIKEIDVTSHSSMKQRVQLKRSHNVLSIYMEYVSGGSLHMLLAKYGALAESMIRNYTAQILFGLDYLHKREIIHRDIKGANILVGRNGDIKLADFGLAKRISSVAAAHTGEKGSIYWVAPEVMKPDQGRYIYDLRADIWSLGFTVIEMATGKHPWHPLEPAQAMCEMLIKGKIPKVPDNLSEEGKDFVQQCLQLDPTSRPSAAELLCHPFIRNRSAA